MVVVVGVVIGMAAIGAGKVLDISMLSFAPRSVPSLRLIKGLNLGGAWQILAGTCTE